ncbi:carbohydrate ABC transporter permease [Psychromarinibacter halotolerans]|uniref:Carbohydrate ABC transporter permease n=1 Tax=Psychromarinibacter halotolerans TaxID=1775175 RepID=A0ABV7GR81_9RHOB|nr:carbohydrate ABC transporter permease [Psychromarinibacter halotolerans]MAQ82705.1 sugar ABC transporter permease [Maritimibacter sp.]MDF0595154.1 carbohydrate ABC transporter permease [Psychromarinibacter halotolerans]
MIDLSTAKGRSRAAANVSLSFVALAFLAPMVWVVLAAFDPVASLSIKMPAQWSLGNFGSIMTENTTIRPFINSLIISAGTSAVVVVLALFAGYPLSRYKLRYGTQYIYVIVFASALPVTAIMVPIYVMFVHIGMVDTLWGVIVFRAASELPFAIWLMKGFMDAIPTDLEEAAWVEGASRLRGVTAIMLPLLAPGLATIFILSFIENWGNFFVPFILLQSRDNYPMAVSLFSFFGEYGEAVYGQLAAFALIYTAPSLLVYFLVQKPLQRGGLRLGGAVKA